MRELGGMTVDELLSRISSAELAEWQYVLEKEGQVTKAIRDGIDPEVAVNVVFDRGE